MESLRELDITKRLVDAYATRRVRIDFRRIQ